MWRKLQRDSDWTSALSLALIMLALWVALHIQNEGFHGLLMRLVDTISG
jgi:hypothetical protein